MFNECHAGKKISQRIERAKNGTASSAFLGGLVWKLQVRPVHHVKMAVTTMSATGVTQNP